MKNLPEIVFDQTRLSGACAVGIATVETLEGGPESTDIRQIRRPLMGAR